MFKPYDPEKPRRALGIKKEEWDLHKEFIASMHNNGLTRVQMLERLKSVSDFTPTMGQLVARLKMWDFMAFERPQILLENSDTSPQAQQVPQEDAIRNDLGLGEEGVHDSNYTRENDEESHDCLSSHEASDTHENASVKLTPAEVVRPSSSSDFISLIANQSTFYRIAAELEMPHTAYTTISRLGIDSFFDGLTFFADLLAINGRRSDADHWYLFLSRCLMESSSQSASSSTLIAESFRLRSMRHAETPSPTYPLSMETAALQCGSELVVRTTTNAEKLFVAAWMYLGDANAYSNESTQVLTLAHFHDCPLFIGYFSSIRAWLFAVIAMRDDVISQLWTSRRPDHYFVLLMKFIFQVWQKHRPAFQDMIKLDCDVCGTSASQLAARWEERAIICLTLRALRDPIHTHIRPKELLRLMFVRLSADALETPALQWTHLVHLFQTKLARGNVHNPYWNFCATGTDIVDLIVTSTGLHFNKAGSEPATLSAEELKDIQAVMIGHRDRFLYDDLQDRYALFRASAPISALLEEKLGSADRPCRDLKDNEDLEHHQRHYQPPDSEANLPVHNTVLSRPSSTREPANGTNQDKPECEEDMGPEEAQNIQEKSVATLRRPYPPVSRVWPDSIALRSESSASSSLRSFRRLARQLLGRRTSKNSLSSGHMSFMTSSSWEFEKVTGYGAATPTSLGVNSNTPSIMDFELPGVSTGESKSRSSRNSPPVSITGTTYWQLREVARDAVPEWSQRVRPSQFMVTA